MQRNSWGTEWTPEALRTLKALWTGILISGLIAEAVLIIFFDRPLYRSAGLIIGALCACFMAWHMGYSIIMSCDYDEKGAMAVMRRGAIVRFLVEAVLMCAACISGLADPISMFAGMFLLKISAYGAPFTEKFLPEVKVNVQASDVLNDEERDAFGYTKAERAALDEELLKQPEWKRKEIEKMRKDFDDAFNH